MPKGLEFTYDQPVQLVHPDGSVLRGKFAGEKISMHGIGWLIDGLEREGYTLKAASATVIASTSQMQALPSGSVVTGNKLAALKGVNGLWLVTGAERPCLAANLWDQLIEITVVHVPGGVG